MLAGQKHVGLLFNRIYQYKQNCCWECEKEMCCLWTSLVRIPIINNVIIAIHIIIINTLINIKISKCKKATEIAIFLNVEQFLFEHNCVDGWLLCSVNWKQFSAQISTNFNKIIGKLWLSDYSLGQNMTNYHKFIELHLFRKS